MARTPSSSPSPPSRAIAVAALAAAGLLVVACGAGSPRSAAGPTTSAPAAASPAPTSAPGSTTSAPGPTTSSPTPPATDAPASTVGPTSTTTAPAFATLAGTWRAHEMMLVVSSTGTGQIGYADLTRCPSCSFATAPPGTVGFRLRALSGATAQGAVTASSDPANYTVGEPVVAAVVAGTPGQLLRLTIGGTRLLDFCNSTSSGQCGA